MSDAEKMIFTADEVATAIYLAATLDPERFSKPIAKALIAKAKACAESQLIPVAPRPPAIVTRTRRRWFEVS